ncbi:MAG: glycosyltransferase [Eubacterium sp.]|nr:glycosyltransferase [Eubacterium sp.]
MRFFIITVLYNERLTECETWKTFLQQACGNEDCCVIVADNSTDETIRSTNRKDAEAYSKQNPDTWEKRVLYLDMHGNAGLPAAYNCAIEAAEKQLADNALHLQHASERTAGAALHADGSYGDIWFVITDQDTTFSEDYLSDIREKAAHTDALLLAPIVKSGGIYLSPCRQNGLRFVPCTEAEIARPDADNLYFINSGLVIRGSVFFYHGLRYDETLFLDFADFDLENQIKKQQRQSRAFVMQNVVLLQQFSGTEKRTAEQDLKRYRQYVHDGTAFYGKWHPEKSPHSILSGRGLKLACKHKDIRFLKKS